ncbi:MAG: hypothetical protein RLZZ597_2345 [Cyanobacteriota bacterium]|jgi:hypothetical protein
MGSQVVGLLSIIQVELGQHFFTDLGYTELVRSLAQAFREVPSKKAAREQWVSLARSMVETNRARSELGSHLQGIEADQAIHRIPKPSHQGRTSSV